MLRHLAELAVAVTWDAARMQNTLTQLLAAGACLFGAALRECEFPVSFQTAALTV